MARIKIHDLTVEAAQDATMSESELQGIVGGLTTALYTGSYFTNSPTSYLGLSSYRLPLVGGSLVSAPALSGVRG